MAGTHSQPDWPRQVAIVTGATAGIGRATCFALAQLGATVVLVGRRPEALDDTRREIARRFPAAATLGLACDVTVPADMDRMARDTLDRFGRIDVLVTCAGILRARGTSLRTLAQMTADQWDEVLGVNLKGVFLANRAVLPAMLRQQSGHILNVSSTSGRKAYAFDTAYCASKFGVIALTEALAEEVRSSGIRVQVLLPGAIDTGMWDQNGPIRRPEFALPVQRVADTIVAMLSLPPDAWLIAPMLEPLRQPARQGWLGERWHKMVEAGTSPRAGGPGPAEEADGHE